MPEDSKKDHHKGSKNEAKEQRKPRRRQQGPSVEKKPENKELPKVPEKPVYEPPPPEFYKNLKRETDEILKITEEENSRYKKKEILSNWSKYEMPIETYDDIEKQENMGADYEELIQAPLTIGGHFQFKHEKSWDISSGPSLYDKYFDIKMDNLAIALSTIPFYERNNLDKNIFSETDFSTMNNRSTRFKQKYHNNKSYTTPELEAQDKILNLLKTTESEPKQSDDSMDIKFDTKVESQAFDEENMLAVDVQDNKVIDKEIKNISPKEIANVKITSVETNDKTEINDENKQNNIEDERISDAEEIISSDDIDNNIVNKVKSEPQSNNDTKLPLQKVVPHNNFCTVGDIPVEELKQSPVELKDTITKESKKNPVIESPEDLEKWLDDFLDD